MALLFIIPLFCIALWLFAESKPDVLRRVVYGSLALITLFGATCLVLSPPKIRAARGAAFTALEQTLRAGDTNAALAALEAYRITPKPRWASDAQATFQLLQTLHAARNRPAPR